MFGNTLPAGSTSSLTPKELVAGLPDTIRMNWVGHPSGALTQLRQSSLDFFSDTGRPNAYSGLRYVRGSFMGVRYDSSTLKLRWLKQRHPFSVTSWHEFATFSVLGEALAVATGKNGFTVPGSPSNTRTLSYSWNDSLTACAYILDTAGGDTVVMKYDVQTNEHLEIKRFVAPNASSSWRHPFMGWVGQELILIPKFTEYYKLISDPTTAIATNLPTFVVDVPEGTITGGITVNWLLVDNLLMCTMIRGARPHAAPEPEPGTTYARIYTASADAPENWTSRQLGDENKDVYWITNTAAIGSAWRDIKSVYCGPGVPHTAGRIVDVFASRVPYKYLDGAAPLGRYTSARCTLLFARQGLGFSSYEATLPHGAVWGEPSTSVPQIDFVYYLNGRWHVGAIDTSGGSPKYRIYSTAVDISTTPTIDADWSVVVLNQQSSFYPVLVVND